MNKTDENKIEIAQKRLMSRWICGVLIRMCVLVIAENSVSIRGGLIMTSLVGKIKKNGPRRFWVC